MCRPKSTVVRIDVGGNDSSKCKQMLRASLRDDSRLESGAVLGCGSGGCAPSMCLNRAVVVAAAVALSDGVEVIGVKSKAGNPLAKNNSERSKDCKAALVFTADAASN